MEQELVSVIMPTYNAAKYLRGSIESILSQTYSNWELLISDDASTNPETKEILEYYQKKDSRIRVFFLPRNLGPACARNKSIIEARGRYIAFCDSDDRWMPQKLEKQIKFMQERKCCLSYTSYFECDENNKINGVVIAPKSINLKSLKHDNKIGCLTAIYDTTMYGKFLMPTIRKRQDWALFLTILKECKIAYAIKEPLAYYRKVKNSVSYDKTALLRYNMQVYRMIFGYSKSKAYMYMYTVFLPSYFYKIFTNKLAYISKIYIKNKIER
ncbi:MAG: glycosyltransferase [Prevotellaceae bacterium]|nr:glycosyltransferase [Prevotellaceae bacterium]